jgi:hypothetical protein
MVVKRFAYMWPLRGSDILKLSLPQVKMQQEKMQIVLSGAMEDFEKFTFQVATVFDERFASHDAKLCFRVDAWGRERA